MFVLFIKLDLVQRFSTEKCDSFKNIYIKEREQSMKVSSCVIQTENLVALVWQKGATALKVTTRSDN